MANRDALRELQSRLAERLEAARTDDAAVSWLAFECAGHGMLVPLPMAGEIFAVGALTPLSHTQPWFLGVANLRGLLHGVVDLAAFLGLRAALAPQAGKDAMREQGRLLAFNASYGAHCAVLVDRLAGLRGAHQLSAVPADASGASKPRFATSQWRDGDGRLWQELDLSALARHEQFLAIAA
jgi:twitching motility protein PilI